MAKTKVLITVKTYPTISEKYDELVCTAGFLEDGTWIRVYPIQFRKKLYEEQYKKYDWVEMDIIKNSNDFRKESYKPVSLDTEIKILGHLDTKNNWQLRKEIVLKNKAYTDLDLLISEAKDKKIKTSLAVFKPTKVIDFTIKGVEREWNKNKLKKLLHKRSSNLFAQDYENQVVKKLPYKFSYKFIDITGKESTMMIEDWEIGQLYWNCLTRHQGNELKATQDIKKKYFDDFAKTKDLYLFLGTSKLHHFTSRNPFMIIGAFYPKKAIQTTLF